MPLDSSVNDEEAALHYTSVGPCSLNEGPCKKNTHEASKQGEAADSAFSTPPRFGPSSLSK